MFKVGDLVYCTIPNENDQYLFDREQPLTVIEVSPGQVHLSQPGLWHKWRRYNNEHCILVDWAYVTLARKLSKEQQIIDKIKYLDKRYLDRKIKTTPYLF